MKYRIIEKTPFLFALEYKFKWWPFWYHMWSTESEENAIESLKQRIQIDSHKPRIVMEVDHDRR